MGQKISFSDIARRMTGFSTPVFGVSWSAPTPEREWIRHLLNFLEDRRVLYVPYPNEEFDYAVRSVIEIRKELTETLNKLPEKSEAVDPVRAMRAACRKFLNDPSLESRNPERSHRPPTLHWMEPGFLVALGELRASFGVQIARLSVRYGIDIEEELASILPASDE